MKSVMICGFLGLLWLPTLGGIFHWDKKTGVDEKRVLEPFPGFPGQMTGIRTSISKLEAWYNDHFGFRKWLIFKEQNLRRQWFGESQNYGVLIGQKGWLFYIPGETLETFQNETLFTHQELEAWRSLLEGRRDWLARRGIPYVFVIPPDKQTIYPEFLPEWRIKPGSTTRLDQFVAYMRTNSTVAVVDLRSVLLDAKTNGQVYLQTDSHWNQYGAFIGCEHVIEKLSVQLPALKALKLENFDRSFSSEQGGNLAGMLAAAEVMKENGFVRLLPKAPLKKLNYARTDGTSAIIEDVENPDESGSALIFGDSFAEWWFPVIGYHFHKVKLVRLYDHLGSHNKPAAAIAHCWKPAMIEEEKPTVVIDEMVEEFLGRENPDHIKELDQLQ